MTRPPWYLVGCVGIGSVDVVRDAGVGATVAIVVGAIVWVDRRVAVVGGVGAAVVGVSVDVVKVERGWDRARCDGVAQLVIASAATNTATSGLVRGPLISGALESIPTSNDLPHRKTPLSMSVIPVPGCEDRVEVWKPPFVGAVANGSADDLVPDHEVQPVSDCLDVRAISDAGRG
jgi:hypothetical protein